MPISAESHPLSSEQAATFDQVLRDDPQYREKLHAAVAAGDKRLFAAHFNGKRVAGCTTTQSSSGPGSGQGLPATDRPATGGNPGPAPQMRPNTLICAPRGNGYSRGACMSESGRRICRVKPCPGPGLSAHSWPSTCSIITRAMASDRPKPSSW